MCLGTSKYRCLELFSLGGFSISLKAQPKTCEAASILELQVSHTQIRNFTLPIFALGFTLLSRSLFQFFRRQTPVALVTSSEWRGKVTTSFFRLPPSHLRLCGVLHSTAKWFWGWGWGRESGFPYQCIILQTLGLYPSDLLIHFSFLHTLSFFICYGLGQPTSGFSKDEYASLFLFLLFWG